MGRQAPPTLHPFSEKVTSGRPASAAPLLDRRPQVNPIIHRRLKLILILFESDTDQLAASVYSSLGKKLLQRGLYRAFGDADLLRDLLIRQAFKHQGKNLSFALRKSGRGLSFPAFGDGPLQHLLFEPYFASHDVTDSLRKRGRRVVLHEDPRDTGLNQFGNLALVNARSHNQDAGI